MPEADSVAVDALRRTVDIVCRDNARRDALSAVASLGLPDAWLAAGFVRNAVWDALWQLNTPLVDIDVVFFDTADCSPSRDRALEARLLALAPGLPWSVKNQARMHTRNAHEPYRDTTDAMAKWPERQTAVALREQPDGRIEGIACFGFDVLFNRRVERNPGCPRDVYRQRIAVKGWDSQWPGLLVVED